MKKVIYSAFISLAFVTSSCEKSKTEPEPQPEPVKVIEPVNILNDGSGFSQVYDHVKVLTTATFQQPSFGISDITLESNGNLNMVYYSIFPSQQDQLYTYYRRTKNLNSNTMVAQASQADTLGGYLRTSKMAFESFRPYTNFFVHAKFEPSTGFGSNNGGTFGGDLTAGVSSPNPIGTCDLGFRCPVMNSYGGFGYFMLDANTPVYKMTCTAKKGGIGTQSNLNEYMGENVHEVYRGNANPEYYAFGLKKDSLKVFKVAAEPIVATPTLVASVPVANLTPGYSYLRPIRHYNSDGSILALFYKENTSNNVYTFVYNFATNTLTKNLDGVKLEYNGTGTDIDLDESGNVYYTGYASNGSNVNGVSIYKKVGSNAPVLVGADNLMKFGTVEKLKYLMGKVYFVVTGKQTGTSAYQLSVIRQN